MFSSAVISRPSSPPPPPPVNVNPQTNSIRVQQLSAATSSPEVRKSSSPTNDEAGSKVGESNFLNTIAHVRVVDAAAKDESVSAPALSPTTRLPVVPFNSLAKLRIDVLNLADRLDNLCVTAGEDFPTEPQTRFDDADAEDIPEWTALLNLKTNLTKRILEKTSATEGMDLGSFKLLENAQMKIEYYTKLLKAYGVDADTDTGFREANKAFQDSIGPEKKLLGPTFILEAELKNLLDKQTASGELKPLLPLPNKQVASFALNQELGEFQQDPISRRGAEVETLMYDIMSTQNSKKILGNRIADLIDIAESNAGSNAGNKAKFYSIVMTGLERMKNELKNASTTNNKLSFNLFSKKQVNTFGSPDHIKTEIQLMLRQALAKLTECQAQTSSPLASPYNEVAREPGVRAFVPGAASLDQEQDESEAGYATVGNNTDRQQTLSTTAPWRIPEADAVVLRAALPIDASPDQEHGKSEPLYAIVDKRNKRPQTLSVSAPETSPVLAPRPLVTSKQWLEFIEDTGKIKI